MRRSGDTKSGDTKSGDTKSGDTKSGDTKSGDIKSGDIKSGDIKSGDIKSGDIKSGDTKSGDTKGSDIKGSDIKESSIQYRASTDLQRQRILEFLQTNETSTNAEICTLLDIKSSRARVLLSQMMDDGLLIAEGDRKGRIYRIKNT